MMTRRLRGRVAALSIATLFACVTVAACSSDDNGGSDGGGGGTGSGTGSGSGGSDKLPTTTSGQSSNVALHGKVAYLSLGDAGLLVLDMATRQTFGPFAPPSGMGSIDDVAVADGWLFVLDARTPGFVAAMSLADPEQPALASKVVSVNVGPYASVSAGGGRLVVAGGSNELVVRAYDKASGAINDAFASTTVGRLRTRVRVAPDGARAYVIALLDDVSFGLVVVDLADPPAAPTVRGSLKLAGAGYSPGGAKPASFPVGIAFVDSKTLVVGHGGGVARVDVSDADKPRVTVSQTSAELFSFRPTGAACDGKTAGFIGAEPAPAMLMFDVRDGKLTSTDDVKLPKTARPTSVVLTETFAVIAGHDERTIIFDR